MSETTNPATPEEIDAELSRLRQSNGDKFQALARQNRMLPPQVILATRLEALIDTFIPDEDKAVLELKFEARVQGILNEALAQLRQSVILEGVNGVDPKKLITGK